MAKSAHGLKAIALGLALVVAPAFIWASTPVNTQPSEVTVFPQGAKVLRRGEAHLPAGPVTVQFDKLPQEADQASMRLVVDGPKGTKFYGLRLNRNYSPKELSPRRREIEKKLQALQDQKDAINDEISSRQIEINLLKSLPGQAHATASDAGAANASFKAADIGQLPAALDKVARRLSELLSANRKDARKIKDLDERIAALQSDMNQGAGSNRQQQMAEADLDLPEGGLVKFELSYQIPSASWVPVYDVRLLNGAQAKLSLAFNAQVQQRSGEDWNNVQLELSTTRVNTNTELPDPTNWWLDFYAPRPLQTMGMAAPVAAAPAYKRRMMQEEAADEAAQEEEAPQPAQIQYAQTQNSEFSASFLIHHPVSLAADGSQRRVAISEQSFPADIRLVAVPRLAKAAFIEAHVKYDGKQPLLPGEAFLYNDEQMVGKTSLGLVESGDSLKLSLGQDDRVKIKRELSHEQTSTSLFGGSKHRSYHWITTVQNFHDSERNIEIREQLPRSKQQEIVVELKSTDPKPEADDPDHPGLLRWNLKLKPEEEAKLQLRYEVRYPEDKQVIGLE